MSEKILVRVNGVNRGTFDWFACGWGEFYKVTDLYGMNGNDFANAMHVAVIGRDRIETMPYVAGLHGNPTLEEIGRSIVENA